MLHTEINCRINLPSAAQLPSAAPRYRVGEKRTSPAYTHAGLRASILALLDSEWSNPEQSLFGWDSGPGLTRLLSCLGKLHKQLWADFVEGDAASFYNDMLAEFPQYGPQAGRLMYRRGEVIRRLGDILGDLHLAEWPLIERETITTIRTLLAELRHIDLDEGCLIQEAHVMDLGGGD